jgi:hypothetical protein
MLPRSDEILPTFLGNPSAAPRAKDPGRSDSSGPRGLPLRFDESLLPDLSPAGPAPTTMPSFGALPPRHTSAVYAS